MTHDHQARTDEMILEGLIGVSLGFDERLHTLLDRNSEGTISDVEYRELESLAKICKLEQLAALRKELRSAQHAGVPMRFVSRLDHLAIAANDTVAMCAWYERVLGLVVHVEAGPNPPQTQKVFLIGPPIDGPGRTGVRQGMMIEVMPRNDTPRHERNSHEPGLSHAAWCVVNFDAALAHLKACKVELLGEIVQAIGGGRLQSFLDCEGNMMQIVERV